MLSRPYGYEMPRIELLLAMCQASTITAGLSGLYLLWHQIIRTFYRKKIDIMRKEKLQMWKIAWFMNYVTI